MLYDDRYSVYINSLAGDNTPLLEDIERQAREDLVPVIRKETQSFLRFLLGLKRPERILEIGTAVGFSALFMAEYNPVPCQITPIENYDKRAKIAEQNFEKAKRTEQIKLLRADAADILPTLAGLYDLVFMDAAKGQYIYFLEDVLRLLSPGGIIFSDNVFFDGEIIESRYAIERRDRTIHSRMRGYLYEITHRDGLITSVIPLGDGIAVTLKEETAG